MLYVKLITVITVLISILIYMAEALEFKPEKIYDKNLVGKDCVDWLQYDRNTTREAIFVAKCCSNFASSYRRILLNKIRYLTMYLVSLKLANCTEFHEECVTRRYQYAPSSELLYDYLCNASALVDKCFPKLNQTTSHNLVSFVQYWYKREHWNVTFGCDESTIMPIIEEKKEEDFHQPCTQVAMALATNLSNTHEIVVDEAPFCGLVWCVFDTETIQNKRITAWTCLPDKYVLRSYSFSLKFNFWHVKRTSAFSTN